MEVVRRYEGNPILTPEQVPYDCTAVYNPAAVKFDGRYILLFRVQRKDARSVLALAESEDGIRFTPREGFAMVPSQEEPFRTYEEYGIEDPRITRIDDTYFITYAAYSRFGCLVGIAKTQDFERFERVCLASEPDNRNAVLFPKRFGGLYARLDRPSYPGKPPSIWISFSPDLVHWGGSRCLLMPEEYRWDSFKVGPSVPPIETPEGWLCIYHGVFMTMNGAVYRQGVFMLDLEDPRKVLGRYEGWIMAPKEPYEFIGYVPNVVFCCGAVEEEDGTLKLYYGAADQCICLATARLEELVSLCISGGS